MKPALRNPELSKLARAINTREGALLALEQNTLNAVATWLSEALLQGADLLRARASLKHGDWMEWLKSACPAVHYLKANRYMHLASNLSRVRNLTGAQSLRAALALCDVPVDGHAGNGKGGKQWVPYMEAINRLSKFGKFIKDNPLAAMPAAGAEELKEDLEGLRANIEPIARLLWPDRFEDKS